MTTLLIAYAFVPLALWWIFAQLQKDLNEIEREYEEKRRQMRRRHAEERAAVDKWAQECRDYIASCKKAPNCAGKEGGE